MKVSTSGLVFLPAGEERLRLAAERGGSFAREQIGGDEVATVLANGGERGRIPFRSLHG